jgi:hypothetical protein
LTPRGEPKFSLELWNKHEAMLGEESLTNNSVEGCNSSWYAGLPANPSLFTVLQHFGMRDSWLEHVVKEAYLATGGFSTTRNKRDIHRDKQKMDLHSLCEDFENTIHVGYLNAMVVLVDH